MTKPQTKSAGGRSSGGKEINVKNRTLFEGDNLDFLQGIDTGTVHLIATDPPFNKNKDFHVTPDKLKGRSVAFKDRWSWKEDIHEDWVESIASNWPATHSLIEATKTTWGYDMAAFLCWLGVRVMEMHRILRDDGSLYLHIDHTAHAYVKALLDSVFGKDNFRNEIIWHYGKWANKAKHFQKNHDTILFYSKSDDYTFNPIYRERRNKKPYNIQGGKVQQMLIYDKENTPQSVIDEQKAKGRDIKYIKNKGGIEHDVWSYTDDKTIDFIPPRSKERKGYDTQKPVALYERIIQVSSNVGDFVLDPFCGCASTLVAAEKNSRQWAGMDLWKGAFEMVLDRLEEEGLVAPEGHQTKGAPRLGVSQIIHEKKPPERSDREEVAAEVFETPIKLVKQGWQLLKHTQMKAIMAEAQRPKGCETDEIVCAGCGREVLIQFTHLDHVNPKSAGGADFIYNRVILCVECNKTKGDTLTLTSLYKKNEETGWMKDREKAENARDKASDMGQLVSGGWETDEVQQLIPSS